MTGGGLIQLIKYGLQDLDLINNNFEMNDIYKMNAVYDRKYNNFEIKINKDSDDLNLDTDMMYPIIINLHNLNIDELFEKCKIVKKKKKKEKKEKIYGFGNEIPFFSCSYRKQNANNRKHQYQNQRQIKSQINMKRR
jgi:hypothetical protein